MNPFDVRSALLAKHEQPPRAMYFVVVTIMAAAIALTGHLGGILSGVVTVNQ